MEVAYKPAFIRDYKRLPIEVQEDVKEKIELFKDPANHNRLKVHKLKGKLKEYYSFSATYSHRVVFTYETKQRAVLLAVGDHDVYK
jgi:mRNA-degrading endonuclease YafQ of YafQ-DinJ toxin-antitoxin module